MPDPDHAVDTLHDIPLCIYNAKLMGRKIVLQVISLFFFAKKNVYSKINVYISFTHLQPKFVNFLILIYHFAF